LRNIKIRKRNVSGRKTVLVKVRSAIKIPVNTGLCNFVNIRRNKMKRKLNRFSLRIEEAD